MTSANVVMVQPPQNLDAEEYVLGACLLSSKAVVACAEHVRPEDFYRRSHAVIFQTILDLDQSGRPVDVLTVVEALRSGGDLSDVGGQVRIAELASVVPATGNAWRHAQIVAEKALMRRLVLAGQEVTRLGFEQPGDARTVLDQAEQAMFAAVTGRESQDFTTLTDSVKQQFDRLTELAEAGADTSGLATGFALVDARTSGLQKGNLIVVAGRPSMGKSGWALCVATHASMKQEVPTALFTLEMSQAEVTQRLVSMESGVDSKHFRSGRGLKSEDWSRIAAASDRLAKAPLFIDDSGAITVMEVRSKARRLKQRVPNLGLVVVDYLQLMTSGKTVERREQEVSQISRSLKVLARELDVPVLAVSQLSRAPEQRHDKRPILSDLRESGGIEQDADLVMFLYRDEYYHHEDTESAGIAELNIAKHRNGPTGVVKLAFVERLAAFRDLATPAEIEAAYK